VQIGTKDDVEKPRFAGLRPGQKMDTIQLADAFELFKLPRTLGTTAEGDTVTTAIGRFGPYIKYGAKYVSLKEDDPYTVTHERALEVIAAKVLADANRIIQDFPAEKIQVLNGRYGPYITDTAKNARVPKDRDPKTLTLEECKTLLLAAPAKGTRGRFGRKLPAKRSAADTPAAEAPEAAGTQDATRAKGKAPKAKTRAKAKAKAKTKAKSKAPASSRKSGPLADEAIVDESPPKMVAAGPGSTKR
jgi:DNA topoisomerase I